MQGSIILQVVLAIVLVGVTLGVVVRLYMKVITARASLGARERTLRTFLANPDDPKVRQALVTDVDLLLARRGMEASPAVEGHFILREMRAKVGAQRSRISSYIELMPQLGLLGTVCGIILSLLLAGGTSMPGLWLALLTTVAGLTFAIISKYFQEVPAQETYNQILELLDDDRVVDAIVNHGNSPIE